MKQPLPSSHCDCCPEVATFLSTFFLQHMNLFINNDNICVCFQLLHKWCPLASCFCHLLFSHHWAWQVPSRIPPLMHTRCLSPALAPLPQPALLCIIYQGPQKASLGGIGSLKHLLKEVVSDHCGVRGKASSPTTHPAAFRRGHCLAGVWVSGDPSSPSPFLFFLPSSCHLSFLFLLSMSFLSPSFPYLPPPFLPSAPSLPLLSPSLLPSLSSTTSSPPSFHFLLQAMQASGWQAGRSPKEVQKEKASWYISKYISLRFF